MSERPSAVGDLVKSCPHAPPDAACRRCIALWLTYQSHDEASEIEDLTARLASAEEQYRRDLAELANTSVSDDTYDAVVVERDTLKAAAEQARQAGVEFALARLSDEAAYLGIADSKVDTIIEKIRQRAALTSAAGGK